MDEDRDEPLRCESEWLAYAKLDVRPDRMLREVVMVCVDGKEVMIVGEEMAAWIELLVECGSSEDELE